MLQDDDALVARVQGGDSEAFDALMLRYQKLVCKIALNYVKNRERALDITQNVFVKVYSHIDKVQAPGMFKPWMLRITYNESMSALRKRRPEDHADELPESLGAGGEGAEAESSQEHQVLRREDRGRILDGLNRLNPKYKLAVSLRYGEGLKVREIADVMGCSEGMVKSLLFRGVRQIRRHVSDGGTRV